MTKTQIWLGAFVLAFVILFFLQELTTNKTEHPQGIDMTNNNKMEENSNQAQEIMNQFGCLRCHGNDLKGTALAPSIIGLSSLYSRDEMINYLRNPSSYMEKDRFQAFREKYRTIMPSFNDKDVKDLGKIVDYLMSLK